MHSVVICLGTLFKGFAIFTKKNTLGLPEGFSHSKMEIYLNTLSARGENDKFANNVDPDEVAPLFAL